ncbi:cysteine desulfurase [Patescibacteria group bacterium]|nr:cysteine desulfurase [Patescibacteria group bacterium]
MEKQIYLDYAATTSIDPKVLEKMMPYLKADYGNPSSIYTLGQKSLAAIDEARESISRFLGCQFSEVVFTGSATEANNLAVFGVIRLCQGFGGQVKNRNQKLHIITSKIDHHSVLEPFQVLKKKGVEITYLPVDRAGLISISDLEKALLPETVMVSIMYANNEIGTIQPIAEIGKILKAKSSNLKAKIYFHTDAVQAANYLDCNVNRLGVDLLTLSAHKTYGPKGVGALFVKEGVEITPLIFGGGHEFGFRSGTENVAGIAGFGKAIEKVGNLKPAASGVASGEPRLGREVERIKKLRDRLISEILKNISGSKLNGSLEHRLPNNTNFSFKGIEGESLVIALDQERIAVSTGSACSAKTLKPSHVLLALGLSEKEALSSLRLTLGRYTTTKEIETTLKVLPKIVERLRKIS